MVMQLTEIQAAAVDPAQSVWVSASAGTGKTHILSNRVVRLLLEGAAPGKILCLTYTKAAAAEMSNRINAKLAAWATAADDVLVEEIEAVTGVAPTGDVLGRARRLFAGVLDAPGGLKIQTLHSFCESLLARFPLEAGISPNATVIDERSSAEILTWCRNRLLEEIREQGDRHPVAAALALFTERMAEDSFSSLIQVLVNARNKLRQLCPDGMDPVDALAAERLRLCNVLGLDPAGNVDQIRVIALADDAFDIAGFRAAARVMLDAGGKEDKGKAEKMIAVLELPDAASRSALLALWQGVFLTKKDGAWQPRARQATKGADKAMPGLIDMMAREADRQMQIMAEENAWDVLTLTMAALAVGFDQVGRYQAEKERRAALDFDDLIEKSRALVSSTGNDMANWVQFKLDGGIDHFLVDEAQDTSPAQWQIIESMAADLYSGESARADVARSLFVVGDSKQSIYGFQGADPHMFASMRRFFKDKMAQAEQPFEGLDLDLSFRSAPAILDLVDKSFEPSWMQQGVALDGAWIDHQPFRKNAGGRVELWPLFEDEKRDAPDPWTLPLTYDRGDSASNRLAREIARRIRDWISGKERLPDRSAAVRAGDILILVRKRNALSREIIRALKDFGIPVAGADRLSIAAHIAVRDLISLGRFLLLDSDDLSLAEALKGPLFALDEDRLMAIAMQRNKGESLWQAMQARADDVDGVADMVAVLRNLRRLAGHSRPFELYAGLLTEQDGRRLIRRRLGDEALDAVDEFLNLALLYGKDHPPTLQGFLAWLDSGDSVIKRDFDASRDEVRVMTVHGSKGLQAPIVFLPDATGRGMTGNKLLWDAGPDGRPLMLAAGPKEADDPVRKSMRDAAKDADAEEQRRLLYVAMTRAEDRLIVCGHGKGFDKLSEDDWYWQIHNGFQRLPNVTEQDDFPHGSSLVYETAQGREIEACQTDEPDVVSDISLPAFVTGPLPEEPLPARPLTPSRPSDEDPAPRSPARSKDGMAFKRGRAMHVLLQFLPDLPASGRQQAALKYLQAPGQGWGLDEAGQMIAEILAIINDPGWSALFGSGSRAEAPISGLVGDGSFALTGRVDRLLVTDDAVLVVDYKTNRPAAHSLDDVAPAYFRQMAAYRAALMSVYPDRDIRCMLLWTEIPLMMEIPHDVMDRYPPVTIG